MSVYGSSPVKRSRRSDAELAAIDNAIIEAISTEHPVTLRGVFYRVVSAGVIEKTELAYRTVSRELLKLRRSGIVDYADITDGTRDLAAWRTWDRLGDMLADAAASYRRALWNDQPDHVLLFTEKDAISGVIRPVLAQWDVPMGVLRGFASESFTWLTANYIRLAIGAGQNVYVYQLGDHDPSGVSAWEVFIRGIRGFLGDDAGLVRFERLAVLPGQITALGLPTRPTKPADPRTAKFVGESVEVDAIPPTELRRIVDDAITSHIDREALRLTRIAERSEREILTNMIGGIR